MSVIENENGEQVVKKIKQNDETAISITAITNDKNKIHTRKDCPYLGTIKRHLLDFDFEKLCSITLQNTNVYCCLVCGKYFQGKGQSTYAYLHSLEVNHHIFINLLNEKVYCLPENYQVEDALLNDIKYNLRPQYDLEQAAQLDNVTQYSRGLDGSDYIPGCVGFNNVKNTDYINVVLQALCRVPLLRQFAIFYYKHKPNATNIESDKNDQVFNYDNLISLRFSEFIRKVWNSKNFKGHVSPHELLQAITLKSKKRFKIDVQGDPINFLSWFIDTFHKEQMAENSAKNSIISDCFQGELEVFQQLLNKKTLTYINSNKIPFFFLTIDIPPVSLFKQKMQVGSIPHIPIFTLLQKFDGKTVKEFSDKNEQYRILKLPNYLIIHLKRFTKNNFFIEKNSTIVSFPLNNLDFRRYLSDDVLEHQKHTKYNLLANICHEGKAGDGFYKIQVRHKATDQWFEIQDLHIKQVMPQLVCVSEAYIQVYELIITDDNDQKKE